MRGKDWGPTLTRPGRAVRSVPDMSRSRWFRPALVLLTAAALLPATPALAAAAAPKPVASAAPVSVAEGAGQAVVVVRLTKKARSNVAISWATVAGSARAGSDFRAARGKVVVKKGRKVARITVRLVDDRVAEPTESFTVALRSRAAKIRTPRVAVRITDDDSSPVRFPQTITGTVSGRTKTAVYPGGTVPDSLHVEWSGTITYVFQKNDPVLGTPWRDQQVHYVVQSASINWTASGTCTGAGTLTGSQLTGDFTVDDSATGPGHDVDPRYWDYAIYLAPLTGTGNMPVTCGPNPGNAAGRVGQGGNGGALVYNGYATPDQPDRLRYSTDRYTYAGTANPPALTYDNTWNLTGSGVAAY